jgi:hypothetical protein
MTEALRLVSQSQPTSCPTLLASYIFADLPAAKFLAQQLDSHMSCVNQIPLHLLVGPAAPLGYTSEFSYRYNTAMFSSPRPQYVTPPSAELTKAGDALGQFTTSTSQQQYMRELRKVALDALPPTGQPKGHAIGFFDQGILIGAGIFLTVVLPSVGYGAWFLGRMGWRTAFSSRR